MQRTGEIRLASSIMFHIVLFMMRKIEQFYQETKSSYLSYYHENGCKIAAKNCEDKLVEFVERIDVNRSFQAEPKVWLSTMKMVGESALQGKDSPVDWLFVYRFIWWKLTDQPSAQKEEVTRLDGLLAKKELLPKKKDAYLRLGRILILCRGIRSKPSNGLGSSLIRMRRISSFI